MCVIICVVYVCMYIYMLYLEVINNGNKEPFWESWADWVANRPPFWHSQTAKGSRGHVHFHSDRDDVPLDPQVSQVIAASPCLSYDRSASFVCGSMSRAASISFQDMAIPPWGTGTKSQAPTVKYKLLTSLKSIPNFERIRLRITFAAGKAGWRGWKTFKACSFLRKASDRGVATEHHGAPSQHSR